MRRRPLPRLQVVLLVPLFGLGTAGVLFHASDVSRLTSAPSVTTAIASAPPPEAADAVRRKDFDTARALLEGAAAAASPDGALARLLLGFYAHACEEIEAAEGWLVEAGEASAQLEDWRLYVLADSAAALDHLPAARAALERLLAEHPGSPLRRRAVERAAELAWQQGDAEGALAWIERGRAEAESGAPTERLDRLAWAIGAAAADDAVRRGAAVRMLSLAPLAAAELKVAEMFRQPSGDLPWREFLSAEQLRQRAAALLAADLAPSALATLETVPAGERSLAWHLLRAEALTRAERGREALAALAALVPGSPAEAASVEWARAAAAMEAATVRRGRAVPPAEERARLRQAARQHLRNAAEAGSDSDLALAALRRLYADLAEEERFDEALEVLRRLRRIAPADATGARHLWQLGWSDYRDRNYSGAIGYWSELAALYPEDRLARSARYWTGRAHEALGSRSRAHEIYREVAAAETTDFYRKAALARLGGEAAPAAPQPARPTEPWPEDASLARARLLSDLGLDDLALSELDLLAAEPERRAWLCLRGLVLARQGKRRDSIHHLWQAYPMLGGAYQTAVPQAALRLYYPLDYGAAVARHAGRQGLAPHLVFAMIRQESAFDAGAVSRAGARGLMQLMPATARELARQLGVAFSNDRLLDAEYSIQLGTTYFRQVSQMFGGVTELALAGYNGGPSRIRRLWREYPSSEIDSFLEGLSIEETKSYVKRVVLFTDSYRTLYPDPS